MRLFFAYWPEPDTVERIVPWVHAAHALYGGRMMRPETLHMTLAFLGKVDEDRTRMLIEACSDWKLPAGTMVLRNPGRFHHAKVVWLGPEADAAEGRSPEWLYRANDTLWSCLSPLGWRREEGPFRPHVSLLRNAQAGDLDALRGDPVEWTPRRCVLVGSEPGPTGSRYTVLTEIGLDPDVA